MSVVHGNGSTTYAWFRGPWRVAAALLLLATRPASAATTLHVPADHPTIQAAIDAAASGDTIVVSDGTYTENINFKGKAITVTSANGPAATIIDGGNAGGVVRFATGETASAVLAGFTIQHGFDSGGGSGGIFIQGASPTITRNIITSNRGCDGVGIAVNFGSPLIQDNVITQNQSTTCSGGSSGGIAVGGLSSAQIIHNTITNNRGGNGIGGGGISLFNAGTTIIRGNLISGNTVLNQGGAIGMVNDSTPIISDNVITQNSASQGGGIAVTAATASPGPLLINNTIVGNTATSAGSELFVGSGPTQIWNNIVFGTSAQAAVFCDGTPSAVLQFNDAFNTIGAPYGGGCTNPTGTGGNVSVDPHFVSAPSDFHLDATSPLIDAGSNAAPSLPGTDHDGRPRLFDGNHDGTATVDIGAYELTDSPLFSLAPTSLHFPGQLVGSSSAPQIVTFINTQTTPITISQIAITGDFSQTTTCGGSLAAGATCTFEVRFTPAQAGARTGALTILDDVAGGSQSVALTGDGEALSLALAPTRLDFSGQIVGVPSAPQTVTLTNTGDVPIALSQVAVTGEFSQTTTCGASVLPGVSCTFQVRFTPTQIGDRAGALTIADTVPGSPQSVALTGAGQDFAIEAAPGAATSATIDSGDTAVYQLQVAATGGFTGTVSLTCAGAPDRTDCSVSPAEVTPSGAATPFTVSVAPSASAQVAAGSTWIPPRWLGLVAIVVALAQIAAVVLARRAAPSRRRRRSLLIRASGFVLAGGLALSGCQHTARPTAPAGTYQLTVRGTANGQTRAVSLPLTVR